MTLKKSLRGALLALAHAGCVGLLCAIAERAVWAADDNSVTPAVTPAPSTDQYPGADQAWALHGQLTNISQKHTVFNSPYKGANSLDPNGDAEETTDLTLFAGWRLWSGAEFWLNTEFDQGFGFDDTLGVAGFPSGGAYKIGANTPYVRLPRAFVRQVFSLGGDKVKVDSAANVLGGAQSADNITLTVGKFSVVDIFDNNSYAHDPRADFLNWAVIDGGAYDYAADSWGYTYGAALEWNQNWWSLRGGLFQMSAVPNGKVTRVEFSQNSLNLEAEMRQQWLGHPGKIKLLAFVNHGSMASYADALRLGAETNSAPDVAQVRHVASRPGVVVNLEQELTSATGAFVRYSVNRGDKEAYEFSDINQSTSAGLQVKGELWQRHDDVVGIAAVSNRLSGAAQSYFAAGGMGILVGDGHLNYAPENIVELYYALHVNAYATLTVDAQHVNNPAYNQDRGPVTIYGARLHASF